MTLKKINNSRFLFQKQLITWTAIPVSPPGHGRARCQGTVVLTEATTAQNLLAEAGEGGHPRERIEASEADERSLESAARRRLEPVLRHGLKVMVEDEVREDQSRGPEKARRAGKHRL